MNIIVENEIKISNWLMPRLMKLKDGLLLRILSIIRTKRWDLVIGIHLRS